jgi:hypothetical protein
MKNIILLLYNILLKRRKHVTLNIGNYAYVIIIVLCL